MRLLTPGAERRVRRLSLALVWGLPPLAAGPAGARPPSFAAPLLLPQVQASGVGLTSDKKPIVVLPHQGTRRVVTMARDCRAAASECATVMPVPAASWWSRLWNR